jgi:hypothetical protein
VRQVSDAFLFNMAEDSVSLIGLFLVGVFFYIDTGLRRLDRERDVFERYLRAGIRIALVEFAFPVGVRLSRVGPALHGRNGGV